MFLSQKRRFEAVLERVQGRFVRVKQAAESVKIRMLALEWDVPITREMRDGFPVPLQAVLEECQDENALVIHSVAVTEERKCVMRVFPKADFSGKKSIVILGDPSGVPCTVTVVGLTLTDEGPRLRLKAKSRMNAEVWAWAGASFGDGVFALELEPEQPNLPGVEA